MNGSPMRHAARSVQLAVMTAPSTTVDAAAAEARRRHADAGDWIAATGSATARRVIFGAAA